MYILRCRYAELRPQHHGLNAVLSIPGGTFAGPRINLHEPQLRMYTLHPSLCRRPARETDSGTQISDYYGEA